MVKFAMDILSSSDLLVDLTTNVSVPFALLSDQVKDSELNESFLAHELANDAIALSQRVSTATRAH